MSEPNCWNTSSATSKAGRIHDGAKAVSHPAGRDARLIWIDLDASVLAPAISWRQSEPQRITPRIEMDSNTVERAIRPHTLTRKNSLFAGSDGAARHWAIAMTFIQTAKLNGVDPMAWLADVLERIVSGQTKS